MESNADSEWCLRSEHGVRDSSRHERPLARPRKQVEGEQDDEPTYVVEDSQDTLSKAEYEALIATKDEDDKRNENDIVSSTEVCHGSREAGLRKDKVTGGAALGTQEVAGIGYSTKRRLAKIVGDEEEENEATSEKIDSRKKGTKPRAHRRKKMKLSFDDDKEP